MNANILCRHKDASCLNLIFISYNGLLPVPCDTGFLANFFYSVRCSALIKPFTGSYSPFQLFFSLKKILVTANKKRTEFSDPPNPVGIFWAYRSGWLAFLARNPQWKMSSEKEIKNTPLKMKFLCWLIFLCYERKKK